ncbi:MAG: threonine--tRNA ligase [Candidatus Aminicenantes bacterium]|nr:threonine--tRNA ligase [Candidatus Aminicenantes bacterium]TFG58686.1 MAG: threonine--tRNA ligase [Candidatus Aminicenantes bacterium]
MSDETGLTIDVLRHSAAHLLAHAVLDLYPEAKTGIGPAVETGYYYDFLREKPFTPEDLEAIEKRMKEIARENVPVERLVLTKEEAVRMFEEKNQELKVALIREKGDATVTVYRQGPFADFCLGPHVPATGVLQHVKLLSVSGAYWKGDERGPQMQRIYGTVSFSKKELEDHLRLLEEAKKRDHRRLGAELDLFSTNDELGGGLILWHPKGARVRAVIEEHWRERHWAGDYDILFTPHIGRAALWQTSGHLGFYKDSMYSPMDIDDQAYYLKPMNCPFHILIYKSRMRSYRDLPLRWAELGTVYRYERSGTLHGLLRVRGFTQDDAHIICTPAQIEDEILRVLDFSVSILADFGFTDNTIELSVRDPKNPAKYCGADDLWCRAEASLVKALETRGLAYERMEGEAVFYGPKIDIKIKDALGRLWQCTTIQFDFNMSERFDMTFVGEDGKEHRPYMVHRALLGSLERFFGVLIEHYNGSFPLWLAPVQVIVLPIAERHEDYARSLDRTLQASGLRSAVDLSREKVGKKIREAEVQKIPLILVVGDKEVERRSASLRVHGQGDKGEVDVALFLEKAKEFHQNKILTMSF